MLCGNIVNNRISLDAIQRCQRAWAELQGQQIVSRNVAEPLIKEMREVVQLIEERIAELRERVWWLGTRLYDSLTTIIHAARAVPLYVTLPVGHTRMT